MFRFSEDVRLAGYEEEQRAGNPLALLEVIKLCYDKGLEFPPWVFEAVGAACSRALDDTNRERDAKAVKSRFCADFGLMRGRRNPNDRRAKFYQYAYLAFEVAIRCKPVQDEDGNVRFAGVNNAKESLADEISTGNYNKNYYLDIMLDKEHDIEEKINNAWREYSKEYKEYFKKYKSFPIDPIELPIFDYGASKGKAPV